MAAAAITDLPVDVCFIISDYLTFEDVRSLSKTCTFWNAVLNGREFWRHRIIKDAGIECVVGCTSENPNDLATLYRRAVAPVMKSAVDMDVCWLGDEYLVTRKDKDTRNKIVVLKHVCFLYIKTEVECPFPGDFLAYFKMRVRNPSVYGETIYELTYDDGKKVVTTLQDADFREAQRIFEKNWFYLYLGEIDKLKSLKIQLVMRNTDGYIWKSGLLWDYFVLVRPSFKNFLKTYPVWEGGVITHPID